MGKLQSQEQGLVSITVTVILMIVISITVLSFAQIIRREQRQALDNQLSSQAFYAAETGINDARKAIQPYLASGTIPDKKKCDNSEGVYSLPMSIDATTSTSYSCLLIGGSPKSLKYELSPSDSSTVFPINASTTISSLDLSWTPSTADNPTTGCPNSVPSPLSPASTANPTQTWPCKGYGMIRVDLVRVDTGTLTRPGLMGNTFTAFLAPTINGTGTVSYAATNIYGGNANQASRPAAKCNATSCKLTISTMSGTKYFARISALYRPTTLNIVAKDSLNSELSLTGAQVMLDATGRAQDVLRRVQVRIPLVNDGLHADYGVQTTDSMCKQSTSFPGYPVPLSC